MERYERAAVLLSLVEKLRDGDSWCGETHVQKGTYFLQDLLGVPLEYDFILYKHGPFSFDLRDEISWMRAKDLLKLQPQPWPYGPKLIPGDNAELLMETYLKPIERYTDRVQKIADEFADMGVTALERYATAYYVSKNHEEVGDGDIAVKIVELKPHISLGEAQEAVEFVAKLRRVLSES
ncbi:MAG: hypothetical protein OXL41_03055 [Nitrospinae bacterium]|nr:hypothetical protein [Nitrospinota bacterium]